MRIRFIVVISLMGCFFMHSQDMHNLWLQDVEPNPVQVSVSKKSKMMETAASELKASWQGTPNASIALTLKNNKLIKGDGFILHSDGVEAKTELGILYGVFEMLRHQQSNKTIVTQVFNPSYDVRVLNHWDNLDGSVERGYAGRSIFWRGDTLEITESDTKRWKEYARANASIGINGASINNVNASPNVLKPEYLKRAKAVADIFRQYGLKTYLSINFASPKVIGRLGTADPLDPKVIAWWKNKISEIYKTIPDFGGFLVKANSEGQPGPQDFGRTHADGANMLAKALAPHKGIVMWRAFVYSPSEEDRAKQAYQEFVPLDGEFLDNVIIQVKNGPIDFQPREPISPLFGAMKKTPVMPELQITQEYLGHSIHLVFLSKMWEEFLNTDTYQAGKGSSVAKVTDGTIYDQSVSAIAGVSNIGMDNNWNGHLFAQSNWYAFGRLAWNNQLSSEQIADEWLNLTFNAVGQDEDVAQLEWGLNFLNPVKDMMLESHEASVNYMTPLGLHHIMSADGHYGPGPWWGPKQLRPDWTPPYYHQAAENGVGFDRTDNGSNAVAQYQEPLKSLYNNVDTCPEELLLWFHHLPWDYEMRSGLTLWDELSKHYDLGVKQVKEFQKTWDHAQPYVEQAAFDSVQRKLRAQSLNAQVWKDACLLFFQQFSKMPIPDFVEPPIHNLDDLIKADQESLMRRFRRRD